MVSMEQWKVMLCSVYASVYRYCVLFVAYVWGFFFNQIMDFFFLSKHRQMKAFCYINCL